MKGFCAVIAAITCLMVGFAPAIHADTVPIDSIAGSLIHFEDRDDKVVGTINVDRLVFLSNGIGRAYKVSTVKGQFTCPFGIDQGQLAMGYIPYVSDDRHPDRPTKKSYTSEVYTRDESGKLTKVDPLQSATLGDLYPADVSNPSAGPVTFVIRLCFNDKIHHSFDIPILSLLPGIGKLFRFNTGTTNVAQQSQDMLTIPGAVCTLPHEALADAAKKLQLDADLVLDYYIYLWITRTGATAITGDPGTSVTGGVLPCRFDPGSEDYTRFNAFMDTYAQSLKHLAGNELPAPYQPGRHIHEAKLANSDPAQPTLPYTVTQVTQPGPHGPETFEVFTYGPGRAGHLTLTIHKGMGYPDFDLWLGTDVSAQNPYNLPTYCVGGVTGKTMTNPDWAVIAEGTFKGVPFRMAYDNDHPNGVSMLR